jgi:ribosomal protein S18 acetylase RimI-like enzyme
LQLTNLPEALRRSQGPLPPHIHLRAVDKSTDLSQVTDLYNLAFSRKEEDVLSPEELARLVWHPGLNPKIAFLAFDGEQTVGLGVASAEAPGPSIASRQGAVELLAVRPEYQQQGIGRALLHALLTWLAEREVDLIGAIVDHPKPFIILRRYGFAPVTANGQDAQGAEKNRR